MPANTSSHQTFCAKKDQTFIMDQALHARTMHPLLDATFGSSSARHLGQQRLNESLPEATALCCRAHGVHRALEVYRLSIDGGGPKLRGLLMAPQPFLHKKTTVALFLGGCGAPAAASVVPVASAYLSQGAAVCVIDYRGFGCSAGAPSEDGLFIDGERMVQHLTSVVGVPYKHLVVHGYAVGAAIAAQLCAQSPTPMGGLVLDRPMASVLTPVACDQTTGLGYLAGLLNADELGEAILRPHAHDHIAHILEHVDPATKTVLFAGAKDSLGVDGDCLLPILRRLGFDVHQATLCSDNALNGYELFACSKDCLRGLCQAIEP